MYPEIMTGEAAVISQMSLPVTINSDNSKYKSVAQAVYPPLSPVMHVVQFLFVFMVKHLQVSRKGSRDVADHMAIQMDDSDSITVSEQSEPSAECWQNMYKLLNFYSLISDPTGILEKSSPENCLTGGTEL